MYYSHIHVLVLHNMYYMYVHVYTVYTIHIGKTSVEVNMAERMLSSWAFRRVTLGDRSLPLGSLAGSSWQ